MTDSKKNILSIITIVLSLFGAVLSYLSLEHVFIAMFGISTGPSFCNINEAFNCDAVSASPWSFLFGFPLAGYGLAFYAGLITLSVFVLIGVIEKTLHRNLILFLSLLASLFSVFLFFISKYQIGTICLLCLGTYLVNFLLFAVSYFSERSEGFLSAIKKSFLFLLCAPFSIFGLSVPYLPGKVTKAGASLLVYSAVFSALFSYYVAENFLTSKLLTQLSSSVSLKNNNKNAVNAWKGRLTDKLDLNLKSGIIERDFYKGNLEAAVEIVEFSDYQCPACKVLHGSLEKLLEEYKDKLKIIHKDFPLDSSCNSAIKGKSHENACFFANASRCAGEQDKFWEVSDHIFSMSDMSDPNPIGRDRLLNQLSVLFKMDKAALDECIVSGRQLNKIKKSIDEGEKLKLNGTPSVWINGKLLDNVNKNAITSIIDDILKSSKN